MGRKLSLVLGALNGTIGDYLVRTNNGLATEMELVSDDAPIALEKDALAKHHAQTGGDAAGATRACVLVHGLMNTEDCFRFADGSDFGSKLREDFGIAPYYVRYNSGLPIPENGAALSALLSKLLDALPAPLEELLLIGYSMGGLVIRSACHVASIAHAPWLSKVKRIVYVGTPHLGAPLERAGRVLVDLLGKIPDPYTRLIADIADLRSDGIKDLGDADLAHEHRDKRAATFSLRDPRHPVPLIPSIDHLLVAGSISKDPRIAMWFGDVMVPLPSASDSAINDVAALALPPDHVKYVAGVSHVALPRDPIVYDHIRAFVRAEPHAEKST